MSTHDAIDHVGAFAYQLVVALVNLDMHAPDSALVSDNLAALVADLRAACAETGAPLRVEVDGELRCGEQVLNAASLQAARLLRLCAERGIGALTFAAGIDADQVLRLLQLLREPREVDAFSAAHCARALAARGIRDVVVELVADPLRRRTVAALGNPRRQVVTPAPEVQQYRAIADFLQSNHVLAFRGEELELDVANGVVERTLSAMDAGAGGLMALATQDDVDMFTVAHSVRVTLLALQVAKAIGASRELMMKVGTAALLHDIGKSRVPQHILFKPGKLDADEREVMAQHARLGGEILVEQRSVDPTAIGAAFCHHMGPRGTGYPMPTLAFQPSGVSRLVRVCDVFEALTSVRPYKPSLPPLHAYVVMQRMPHGFDPPWLRAFIRAIGLYPVGSELILDGCARARVTAVGDDLHRPTVRLLTDRDGNALPDEARATLALGEQLDGWRPRATALRVAGRSYELPELHRDAASVHVEVGECGCVRLP